MRLFWYVGLLVCGLLEVVLVGWKFVLDCGLRLGTRFCRYDLMQEEEEGRVEGEGNIYGTCKEDLRGAGEAARSFDKVTSNRKAGALWAEG